MKNLSISSLTLCFLKFNSPLLETSKSYNRNSLSLYKSFFFNSFSPIVTGHAPSLLNIKHNSFKNFLSHAISLNNQEFFNQRFSQKLYNISESNVNISNCLFLLCFPLENSYDGCEGGAILCRGVILHLSKSLFRSNYAFKAGGAIRISCSALSDITDCRFYENSVTNYAGAFSAFNVFELFMSNCSFFYNYAEKMNAALGLALCPSVILKDLTFGHNGAKHCGTMMFEASSIHLHNVISYKNHNLDTGSIFTSNSTILEIKNGKFCERSDKIPSILSNSGDTITILESEFSIKKDSFIKKNGANVIIGDSVIYSKELDSIIPTLNNYNKSESSTILDPKDDNWNNINQKDDQLNNINQKNDQLNKNDKINPKPIPKKQSNYSILIFISYFIVIILLGIGIKKYFSTGYSNRTNNLSSLFDDDDDRELLLQPKYIRPDLRYDQSGQN